MKRSFPAQPSFGVLHWRPPTVPRCRSGTRRRRDLADTTNESQCSPTQYSSKLEFVVPFKTTCITSPSKPRSDTRIFSFPPPRMNTGKVFPVANANASINAPRFRHTASGERYVGKLRGCVSMMTGSFKLAAGRYANSPAISATGVLPEISHPPPPCQSDRINHSAADHQAFITVDIYCCQIEPNVHLAKSPIR